MMTKKFLLPTPGDDNYPYSTVKLWPHKYGGEMLVTVHRSNGTIIETFELGEVHDEYGILWDAVENIIQEQED